MFGGAQQVGLAQRLARLAELMAELLGVRRQAKIPRENQEADEPRIQRRVRGVARRAVVREHDQSCCTGRELRL